MKKFLMSLVLMTGMLFATGFEIPCLTCEDGIDGKGWTEGYYNPETGQVVFNSDDGLGFTTDDLRGAAGADGLDGESIVGAAGKDGKDGQDFNSELYTVELIKTQKILERAAETANQAVAGAAALSAIDFGSTCKGKTEFGVGVGTADSYVGTDYAGGVGIKHGFTDETAGIIKGWKSKNTHAVGAGLTYAF